MASKKPAADQDRIAAFVLCDCALGRAGQVITVTPEQAAAHAGEIDTHPAAVAAAQSKE
jgi:hypothetical protein